MAAVSFTCPACHAPLKFANPVPAGKKIKCPKCAAVFPMPSDEIRDGPPARPAVVQAVAVEEPVEVVPRGRRRDDDTDDGPRVVSRRRTSGGGNAGDPIDPATTKCSPLQPFGLYRVAVNNYIAAGGSGAPSIDAANAASMADWASPA